MAQRSASASGYLSATIAHPSSTRLPRRRRPGPHPPVIPVAPGQPRRPGSASVVAPLALGLFLVGAWQLVTLTGGVRRSLFPAPLAVWSKLVTGLVTSGTYWPYIGRTFAEAAAGCVAGASVALPLAVVIVHSRWVNAAVTPFLGATQAIPAVALAPLLILWVGYGLPGIVTLCALMVFFPILVSSVVGLRHVDPDVLDAASLDGAGFWGRLWHMRLPLAGATILAGVRNGFTLSVTGAFVGEMVMGGRGLGQLVMAQQNADTAGLFASIIVMAVLASTIYSLLTLIEKRVFSHAQR